MELSPSLRCLFSARVEERDGSYVVEVPKSEVDLGSLAVGEVYRVGVLRDSVSSESSTEMTRPSASNQPRGGRPTTSSAASTAADGPPVEEGEIRQVEIEDVGDQGDGLARVGPGYVVFVSGASVGDRPTVRITSARENVAFAEVVE